MSNSSFENISTTVSSKPIGPFPFAAAQRLCGSNMTQDTVCADRVHRNNQETVPHDEKVETELSIKENSLSYIE